LSKTGRKPPGEESRFQFFLNEKERTRSNTREPSGALDT